MSTMLRWNIVFILASPIVRGCSCFFFFIFFSLLSPRHQKRGICGRVAIPAAWKKSEWSERVRWPIQTSTWLLRSWESVRGSIWRHEKKKNEKKKTRETQRNPWLLWVVEWKNGCTRSREREKKRESNLLEEILHGGRRLLYQSFLSRNFYSIYYYYYYRSSFRVLNFCGKFCTSFVVVIKGRIKGGTRRYTIFEGFMDFIIFKFEILTLPRYCNFYGKYVYRKKIRSFLEEEDDIQGEWVKFLRWFLKRKIW